LEEDNIDAEEARNPRSDSNEEPVATRVNGGGLFATSKCSAGLGIDRWTRRVLGSCCRGGALYHSRNQKDPKRTILVQ
jgi:hypothetical protein